MLAREDKVDLESPKTDEYRRLIEAVRSNNGTYKFCSSSLPRERPDLSKLVLSQTLFSFLVAVALIPSFVQSTFIQPFHSIALNHWLGRAAFDQSLHNIALNP